ncbi:cell division protein FtsW [Hasllibacter halocynthiae]|uniref:Probable peptidoglycan glycosyltransferase FtsW n=1 Tax=Hasllibacter halocynthiae TaxID=595589 RepID=A0A2T0X9H7_9RHOB|nr:putative peptidoglycan glycosyltransferase FtsW [Hasllibacter halocynthiae]PRY95579.1 cell division protein FtsW [Hasllibacter halocynthiae]
MTQMVHGAPYAAPRDPVLPRWWRSLDRWTLACILALVAIGLILGLAASPTLARRNGLPSFHYVERQAIFASLAICVMLVLSMMTPRTIRRLGTIGFAFAFVAVALLPVLGTDFGKGATRWYSLGFASVQPSEFLKPCFVVTAAWLMAGAAQPGGIPGRALSFGLTLLIVAFLALQPDFGQAALVLFSWGVMWFVAGASIPLIASLGAGVVAFGMVAYGNSEHFARRIDGFLNPEIDPRTQIGYATGAIREGGFFGVGIGEGQVKVRLPDAHTDFIIAVAAEEFGLMMVMGILALFGIVVVRSLHRLLRERDAFARLAGTGMVCAFGVQALINTGVAVRLLPAKGMTLPFVSYGGSSLIATGIAVGTLLALTRHRPQGALVDAMEGR